MRRIDELDAPGECQHRRRDAEMITSASESISRPKSLMVLVMRAMRPSRPSRNTATPMAIAAA